MATRDAIRWGVWAVAAGHLVPSTLATTTVRRATPGLRGDGRPDHIALTFDDGPDPRTTPHVLDALAALGVHATFFVLGAAAYANPDVVRRAAAEGHEVAVHGWTHRCQLLQSPAQVAADIARAAECVHDLTGTAPRVARPPYGIATGAGLLAARRAGMRTVLWGAAGHDWGDETSARRVSARVRADAHGGTTVLLHDAASNGRPRTRQVTIPAVVQLLPSWRARGYKVGPLREHWDDAAGAA